MKLSRTPPKTAILLGVFCVKKSELSKEFLEYDTSVFVGENYELKGSNFLLLLFNSPEDLFTTLRPAFPSRKEEYYRSKIGQEFEVIVSNLLN